MINRYDVNEEESLMFKEKRRKTKEKSKTKDHLNNYERQKNGIKKHSKKNYFLEEDVYESKYDSNS